MGVKRKALAEIQGLKAVEDDLQQPLCRQHFNLLTFAVPHKHDMNGSLEVVAIWLFPRSDMGSTAASRQDGQLRRIQRGQVTVVSNCKQYEMKY